MGRIEDQPIPTELTQSEPTRPPFTFRLVIADEVPRPESPPADAIPSVEELREIHNLKDETWFSNVWSLRFMEMSEINEQNPWVHNPVNTTKAVNYWRCPADYYAPKSSQPKNKILSSPSHTRERPLTRGTAQLVLPAPSGSREQMVPSRGINEKLIIGNALHKFIDIVHAADILESVGIDSQKILNDPQYAVEAFTTKWLSYLRDDLAKRKDKKFVDEFDRLLREGKGESIIEPIEKYLTMHRELGSEVIASEQKFSFYLLSRKHPYVLGDKKSREVPIYGRFDQIRQRGERLQILEAKSSIHSGNKQDLELQTGLEFLGIQPVIRRMLDEGKISDITEESVSELFIPDLLGYDFMSGELHQLIITDMGGFVSSLRNILFDTHILMSMKYPGRNPDHDPRYCAGEDEERMRELAAITVKIGNNHYTLDERYRKLRQQLERYKETYVWAPVDLKSPDRRRSFIKPRTAEVKAAASFPRIRFSVPGVEHISGQPSARSAAVPKEEVQWKQRPGVLRVETGREIGGQDTAKILEQILLTRNRIAPDNKERYLHPSLSEITAEGIGLNPDLLEQAYQRIDESVENNETIFVIGHRDFDGIAGTVLVTEALNGYIDQVKQGREDQSNVGTVIPDFPVWDEGYGLTKKVVDRIAGQAGKKLFITVDLGVSSEEGIRYAKSLGIDTIVLDHHKAGDATDAHTLIHTTEVSAAGIAYVFVEGFWPSATPNELQKRLELAGPAQLADNMSMEDTPSRILAKYGYEALKNPGRVGLQELLVAAKIRPGYQRKEEYDMFKFFNNEVSYQVIPLINATGRVGDPMDCFHLLTVTDQYAADVYIDRILTAFEYQKELVDQATFQARNCIKLNRSHERLNFLVSDAETYGINSLVAQKIMEDTGLPTIVLSRHGNVYSGSGRSIKTFNLREALAEQAHLLQSDGGPPGASGIRVREDDLIPLRTALVSKANRELTNRRLERILWIDMPLSFMHLDTVYEAEQQFRPYGRGNEQPVHNTRGVTMSTAKSDIRYFSGGKHVELRLHRGKSREIRAVGFFMGQKIKNFIESEKKKGIGGIGIDVAYTLTGDPSDHKHAMIFLKSFRKGTIKEHHTDIPTPQEARSIAALRQWPKSEE